MKLIGSATLAMLTALLATPVQAAELLPAESYQHHFGDGSAAVIYYTEAPDGLRVVTTWQSDDNQAQRELRFETTIAAGQSVTLSMPSPHDAPAQTVAMRRIGDHLQVTAGD